jgi:nitrate reductase NapE component
MRTLSLIFGLIFVILFASMITFLYTLGSGVFGVFMTALIGGYGLYFWFSEMVFTEPY